MQFRKRETEEELQSRMKSYTWQQKLVNEEHWLSLQYHDSEVSRQLNLVSYSTAIICPFTHSLTHSLSCLVLSCFCLERRL
jgi:hypothetical protein